MNESKIIKQAMSLLGRRKSKAKSRAARANGKRGGRPKVLGKGQGRKT